MAPSRRSPPATLRPHRGHLAPTDLPRPSPRPNAPEGPRRRAHTRRLVRRAPARCPRRRRTSRAPGRRRRPPRQDHRPNKTRPIDRRASRSRRPRGPHRHPQRPLGRRPRNLRPRAPARLRKPGPAAGLRRVSATTQQQPSPPQAATPTLPFPIPAHRMLVTVCTILATLMQSLDSTIPNVALPYMQGTMSASQDEINWVLTSYIVAAAIMTAPTGFLAARFGRTRLFVTAVVGFTIASALCGLAQTLNQIVIFRVLQGVFGAALVPLSQSVMYELYPPEQRARAMGLWTMGVMMGPICGPILGGWLTENYSWRWVFYINVPFGVFTAIGLLIFLKESAHSRS